MADASTLTVADWVSVPAGQITARTAARFGNGVLAQVLDHDSFELDDVPGFDDLLFVYRMAGEASAERRLGERWERATTRRGSITVMSPGQPSAWRLEGTGTLLALFVPPALISRIFDPGGETSLDFVDRLGSEDPAIGSIAEAFGRESEAKGIGGVLYAEALLTQLVVTLARRHSGRSGAVDRDRASLGEPVRRLVVDYVEAHLGEDISLSDLAGLAGLGLSQFNRNFRASLGLPPYRYVLARRIARAEDLLAGTKTSIAEIARATGFAHQAHLTTTFKRISGRTPAAFRAGR